MTLAEDAATLLAYQAKADRDKELTGEHLVEATGIPAERLNDAVVLLEDNGYAKARRYLGTAPFNFYSVAITPQGRLETELAETRSLEGESVAVRQSPYPVGSPYGFKDEDWELIRLEQYSPKLIVAFGHQFESRYYNTERLTNKLRDDFTVALAATQQEAAHEFTLDFVPLRAVYGTHVFNQIAAQIIASDIAVFETSDLNPNVMIEMGVALTWGTRVHPIRHMDSPELPSDISGQTWARYWDDGFDWEDSDHVRKLAAMVGQAIRKKSARL